MERHDSWRLGAGRPFETNKTGVRVKSNMRRLYGIPFVVGTDYLPLKNPESLATKVNRAQRWFDYLIAYTYEI